MHRRTKTFQSNRADDRALAKALWSTPRSYSVARAARDSVSNQGSTEVGEGQQSGDRPNGGATASKRRKLCDVQDNGASLAEAPVVSSPVCRDAVLDRIIGELDTLDRPELERVAARLAVLLDSKTPKTQARRVLEQDWHAAAEVVLRPMGIAMPPVHALAKQGYVASFRRGTILAEDYVNSMQPSSRVDRIRARLLISANLLEWMRSCQVPVSFKAWALNLPNAATAMERAYPGWRQSGLLHRVLASTGT